MRNIDELYTKYHLVRMGIHCYPTEFLIRTMLGSYPKLKMAHNYNKGGAILDWACGDGRNLILLNNLGLKVCAFEITDKICNGVKKRMKNFGVNVDIRVGRNSNVPFDSEYFDYVVASSSLYYVDHGENFNANLAELARVTKRGGYIILTLAHPKTFVLKDAIEVEDSHFEITKDPYNLRNGDIFYVFKDKTAIVDKFSRYFDDICIGQQNEDYYGMNIRLWLVVAKRK